MKRLIQAAEKAAQDTARFMTSDLRSKATESGWHPHVVENIRVEYGKGGFAAKIHPDVKTAAFDHEYGTETTGPTAVVRTYKTHTAEGVFMKVMKYHIGGKK